MGLSLSLSHTHTQKEALQKRMGKYIRAEGETVLVLFGIEINCETSPITLKTFSINKLICLCHPEEHS